MSKKKETILVIDDSDEARRGYCDILVHEGYRVLESQDGREALNIMKDQSPNLVLLDLLLPEMSGVDVLRQIKADPRTKDIPAPKPAGLTVARSAHFSSPGCVRLGFKSLSVPLILLLLPCSSIPLILLPSGAGRGI